jgi:predicted ribosomally synthesized peptide with nif11-like leader
LSTAEAERFVNDLATKPQLLAEVKPRATGLAAVVAIGKQHGYDFTLDEAKKYIQSRSPRELTDKQLDAIAGGKHHGHSQAVTSVKVAQTAAVATSAVEAAEVATTAVQVAEGAADVAAAAEAVVVVAAVLI